MLLLIVSGGSQSLRAMINHVIFLFRISWKSNCKQVHLFRIRIKSSCDNIHAHKCSSDVSVSTPCLHSEDINVGGNHSTYNHLAMSGTRFALESFLPHHPLTCFVGTPS